MNRTAKKYSALAVIALTTAASLFADPHTVPRNMTNEEAENKISDFLNSLEVKPVSLSINGMGDSYIRPIEEKYYDPDGNIIPNDDIEESESAYLYDYYYGWGIECSYEDFYGYFLPEEMGIDIAYMELIYDADDFVENGYYEFNNRDNVTEAPVTRIRIRGSLNNVFIQLENVILIVDEIYGNSVVFSDLTEEVYEKYTEARTGRGHLFTIDINTVGPDVVLAGDTDHTFRVRNDQTMKNNNNGIRLPQNGMNIYYY